MDATKHSDLAEAIATAEGFYVEGSIPYLSHNPGDLVLGDKGHGTLGAEKITVFEDDATGWAALEHELTLIRTRRSHIYTPSTTIREMASHWTRTQQQFWCENVCDYLTHHGRPANPDTFLKDVL